MKTYPHHRNLITQVGLFFCVLGLAVTSEAQVILDFETYLDDTNTLVNFQRGEEVTDQYDYVGVIFSGQKYTSNGLRDAELWIFDTNNPTLGASSGNDGDPDLVSPGYGPGNADTNLDNILVVQERTRSTDIPDDNARGGIIKATFTAPVFLHSLGVLDIEREGKTSIRGFNANDEEVFSFSNFDNYGDNSYNLVLFDEAEINYLIFDHKGSGALTGFEFTPVPEPATIAGLSIVGLAGLLLVRQRFIRRIKAKKSQCQ
jgi:hypothetical protein